MGGRPITYAIRKYALATLNEHFLLGGGLDFAVEAAITSGKPTLSRYLAVLVDALQCLQNGTRGPIRRLSFAESIE